MLDERSFRQADPRTLSRSARCLLRGAVTEAEAKDNLCVYVCSGAPSSEEERQMHLLSFTESEQHPEQRKALASPGVITCQQQHSTRASSRCGYGRPALPLPPLARILSTCAPGASHEFELCCHWAPVVNMNSDGRVTRTCALCAKQVDAKRLARVLANGRK